MVSKAKATSGSIKAIDYILNDKGLAREIGRNKVVGEDGVEIIKEFREIQSLNSRCKKNTFSIIISPSNEYKLNEDDFEKILYQHLDNLDLIDHQWIATLHSSTKNPHIHIIANRINDKGIALKDNFIGKKAQLSAEKIAIALGMETAKERSIKKRQQNKQDRKHIYTCFKQAALHATCITEVINKLKSEDIDFQLVRNSKSEIQGMKFAFKGEVYKASQINKECRVSGIKDILANDSINSSSLKNNTINFINPKSLIHRNHKIIRL